MGKVSPIDAGNNEDGDQSSIFTSAFSSRVGALQEPLYRMSPLCSTSEATLTNNAPNPTGETGSTIRIVPHARRDDSYVGPAGTRPRWNLSHKASTVTEETLRSSSPEPTSAIEVPRPSTSDPSVMTAETLHEPRLSWTMTISLLTLVTVV